MTDPTHGQDVSDVLDRFTTLRDDFWARPGWSDAGDAVDALLDQLRADQASRATHGQDGQGDVLVPRDALRALWGVYETWGNTAPTDPGDDLVSHGVKLTGIVSLLGVDDAYAMEAATDAVEPHEVLLRGILNGAPALREQGGTLRAAQIQAVRDVMGWGEQPDAFNEQAVADTAAELVDAVLAAGPRRPTPHLDAVKAELETTRAERNQAHAAGYAAAVANALDDDRFVAWLGKQAFDDRARALGPARRERRQLADYLEAVGPGQEDQKLTEEEQRGTGRVWVFSLDAKPDVLFADGTHRYWSTHCRHGRHEDCSATELTGEDVNAPEGGTVRIGRTPAQCKTCSSPCICPCHEKSHG